MANTPNQTSFDAHNQPPNRGNAGKGRPKGVPNTFTKAIKEMVTEALHGAHPDGGVAYLIDQAQKNPSAFLALVGKVMPMQTEVSGPNGQPLQSVTRIELVAVAPHVDGED